MFNDAAKVVLLVTGILGVLGISQALELRLPFLPLPKTSAWLYAFALMLATIKPLLLLFVCLAIGYFAIKRGVFRLASTSTSEDQELHHFSLFEALWLGFGVGLISAVGLIAFELYQPSDLAQVRNAVSMSLSAKLLFLGITGEIYFRLGLMSLVTMMWIRIADKHIRWLRNYCYLAGLLTSASLFGLGQLPMLVAATDTPLSINSLFTMTTFYTGLGVLFGVLYWKAGFEASVTANLTAHLLSHVAFRF